MGARVFIVSYWICEVLQDPNLVKFFFLSPFGIVVYIVIREVVNSVDKQFGVFTNVNHLESDRLKGRLAIPCKFALMLFQ